MAPMEQQASAFWMQSTFSSQPDKNASEFEKLSYFYYNLSKVNPAVKGSAIGLSNLVALYSIQKEQLKKNLEQASSTVGVFQERQWKLPVKNKVAQDLWEQATAGENETGEVIQSIMDNIMNDTSLGLTDIKKQTIVGIGSTMLEEGYESAFVAGMLVNIIHEGTAGLFENSNYASNPSAEPKYLVYMDNKYNYRSSYSGQNITDKNLSDVFNILLQLEYDNWQKGKFGLGSVQ